MKTLRVMDSSGDSVIEFEPGVEMVNKAEKEARALFDRMTKKGAAVFAVNRGEGKPDVRVRDFNALEQDNVIVPAIIGG